MLLKGDKKKQRCGTYTVEVKKKQTKKKRTVQAIDFGKINKYFKVSFLH